MEEDIILKMQYKQLYIKVSLIFIIYFLIVFIMKNSIEFTPFFIISFFMLFLVLFVIKTQTKDSNKIYKQIDMLYYNLLNERKSHNSFDDVSGSLDLIINDVKNRIIDIDFNNTIELNSAIYFCRVNHNEYNYSSNPTYVSGSKIVVKNNVSDLPVTYITSIGLYSPDNELLATAKLSEPIRKDPNTELTLRVRLDY